MSPLDPRLLRLVPQARGPVLLLAGTGALQGVATLGAAVALTALVVAAVRDEPLTGPAVWTAALFGARGLLAWVAEGLAARSGAAVSTALRERLLATWLERDTDHLPDRARALTLATQGTTAVEPYVSRYLPALVTAAVVPPLAVLALLVVDWPSGLVVILTLPLLPLFAALIGMATQEDTRRRWRALSDLSGHFLDVVRGLPTLVAYGRGERQVRTITAVSEKHRTATMRTLRLAFLSSAALELLASLSVAIVAVIVGIRLTHGSMDLAPGLLAILLAPEAYWPIRRVGAEYHSAADGAEALAEIVDELDAPTPRHERRNAPAGLVRARDLHYTYPGSGRELLGGVDLEASSGLTTITGPSGVGKTTLLEVLAGLRRPDLGEVTTAPVHLVSQRPFLGAGTIRGNLALGAPNGTSGSGDALWEALRQVGLDGVVAGLPEGLDSDIGDDGFGLSAGQRARLVLARALLSSSTVILLDEPTAHLDPASAEGVHEVIDVLATRRTVIAVTHRPELVARAHRHVHLTGGTRLQEVRS